MAKKHEDMLIRAAENSHAQPLEVFMRIPGRALAAVSAVGLAAGLAGCQLPGRGGNGGNGDSGAAHATTSPEVKDALASTQAAAGSKDPVEVSSELPVIAGRLRHRRRLPVLQYGGRPYRPDGHDGSADFLRGRAE